MDLPDAGAIVRAQGLENSLVEWGRDLCCAVFDRDQGRPLGQYLRRLSTAAPEGLSALLAAPPPDLPPALAPLFVQLRAAVDEGLKSP